MATSLSSHSLSSAVSDAMRSNDKILFPALAAFMEATLNHLLYRETALKPARLRLAGKTLSIELKEIQTPLVLIFSEKQLGILSQWSEPADCSMKATIPALLRLRDRQCLSALINSGEIVIEGDMQVIQQWSALLDMSEWDPAHYLAPYVGDIAGEGISRMMKEALKCASNVVARKQAYFTESLTEEWKIVPNALEVAYFSEEVDAVANKIIQIEKRLAALEGKYDAQ